MSLKEFYRSKSAAIDHAFTLLSERPGYKRIVKDYFKRRDHWEHMSLGQEGIEAFCTAI